MISQSRREDGLPYEPACIPVEDAVGMYLSRRRSDPETTSGTVETHRKRLNYLIEFCESGSTESEEIEYVCDIRGHHLEEYREWRRSEATVKVDTLRPKTLAEHMKTIRVFFRAMEQMEYVRPEMSNRVFVPDLSEENEVNDEILEYDRALNILDYIARANPGTKEHVVWVLFVKSGVRLGTVRAADLDDYHPNAEIPHIKLRHRPESETPLKNGNSSERSVYLSEESARVLNRYIEHNHDETTDKHGRMPLVGTTHGRAAKSTIRGMVYKWTRPCKLNKECPHGKSPESCKAANNKENPSACPSMKSPHPLRKGYVTRLVKEGLHPKVVGDRVDADPETLEKHYDQSTDEEKMQARKELIEQALDDKDDEYGF